MRTKDVVRMREAQKDSRDMTVFASEEYELMQVEVKKIPWIEAMRFSEYFKQFLEL